jgi:hypothetical protein
VKQQRHQCPESDDRRHRRVREPQREEHQHTAHGGTRSTRFQKRFRAFGARVLQARRELIALACVQRTFIGLEHGLAVQ